MTQLQGTRLGPYEIITPLGAGGMGEVYRARDTKLNRDVAIKVLLPAVANDPDRLARFSREAQVLASLNHPNIAHIHGLEEAGSVTALVMELVEGEDLSRRIARGPIPLDEALPIAKQIADALEAAHEQGIIHRDLKPANIKVRPDGTVKVLDFGLAKAMDPAGGLSANAMNSPTLSMHATQAGIILGTAAYMSPEQAAGKPIDKRSDVWAFGVVLFEMLAGRQVFGGETVSHVLAAVLKDEPDWALLPATTPPAIRRLLRRCLEKDRKRRLADAADAKLEIDDGLMSSSGGEAVPLVAATRSRWHRVLSGAIAATALVTLAASVWIYSRQQHAAEVVRFVVMPPFGATRPAGHAFAISPDRRVVAFRAVGAGGVGHIFVRRLDQAEAQPVPGTDHGRSPFWAPDSRSLGFMKEDGLYRTDLDGNAPRRLCEVSGSSTDSADATWGSRGIIVFSSNKGGLFQAADTGGPPAPLTSLDAAAGEGSHRVPWFLPDGRHVLFLARTLGQTRGVIWAVSIDDGVRTRVAESSGGAAYVDGWLLTTTAAPRELVAQPFDPRRLMVTGNPQPVRDRLKAADSNGTAGFSVSSAALAVERPPGIIHQLTWMDRAGRTLDTVGPAVVTSEFSLAPDERRVVANVNDRASLKADLWVFELPNDEGTRLTFRQDSRRPMWALDGRHVYFTTAPSYELRTVAIGAEPEPFDGAGDLLHFEDATRDGRYLIFKSQPNPFSRIWLQRVGVPSERRVMVQGQFDGAQARVSPTGRWLAYSRQLPRGPEVFVQPFDRPGDQIQVSRTGGMGPVWRADNRELFYESAGALMAAPVTERGAAIDVGTPQKLFRVHTQGNVANQPHNVEVAANGQKFLVNTIVGDSDNVPIEVTLNWTAGLKR